MHSQSESDWTEDVGCAARSKAEASRKNNGIGRPKQKSATGSHSAFPGELDEKGRGPEAVMPRCRAARLVLVS